MEAARPAPEARRFGKYTLVAKLATGGMAEIYLARPQTQAGSKDLLVLKRILPHLAEDDHFVTMFRDEADLAARLVHKNVCNVFSFGQYGGTWFIAMEYLHGVPLSRMMTKLSKASAKAALSWPKRASQKDDMPMPRQS